MPEDAEWTPRDDIGRSIAGITHGLVRLPELLERAEAARRYALESIDAFMAALTDGEPDASDLTDEEAEEFARALDTILGVRALLDDEVPDA